MRCLIVVFILQSVLFGNSCSHRLYKLESVSPTGKYIVRLEEKAFQSTGKNHFPYMVYLNVRRQGQPLLKDTLFSARSSSDTDFVKEYPDHDWLADNALWLGNFKPRPQTLRSTVLVQNDISKEVSALFLTVGYQRFLLFDLSSAKTIKLSAITDTHESSDDVWIAAFGQFNDGSFAEGEGNFDIPETNSGITHINLSVKEGHIAITVR